MPLWRTGVCVLMCLAAVAVQFSALRFEALDPCDESYQAINALNYTQAPAAMLCFFIGHGWQELFGTQAIALRCLGAVGVLLSLAIGAVYYGMRRRDTFGACFLFMVTSFVAFPAVFHIFNWDTAAYPFEALMLVAALEAWRRPGTPRAALLGAAVALCSLARVPLVAALPLAMILVISQARRHNSHPLRHLSALLGAYFAVWLLVTTWMCGSTAEYLGSFVSKNFISGHSPADLGALLIRARLDIPDLPLAWLPMTAAVVCATLYNIHSRRLRGALRAAAALLTVAVTVGTALICERLYVGITYAFGLPLLVAVAGVLPLKRFVRQAGETNVPLIPIVIALTAVALTALGSDSWFERYESMFALAPLTVYVLPDASARIRRWLRQIMLFCLLGAAVYTGARTAIYATRVFTVDMSAIPRQKGLLGRPDQYRSWRAATALMNALTETDGRALYTTAPYGLLLCHPEGIVVNFNNFRPTDSAEQANRYADATVGADAVIFSIAKPESMPLCVRALSEEDFVIFTPAAEAGFHGFVMVRSDAYASQKRAFLRNLDSIPENDRHPAT